MGLIDPRCVISAFGLTTRSFVSGCVSWRRYAGALAIAVCFSSVTLRETEMKQSRFTEERIIAILREHEAGSKTGDVCRKHGVSSATFYKWKAKYGGLDVSDARRLRALEDENAKLKKLLAEAMLDNAMLKDINSKKW